MSLCRFVSLQLYIPYLFWTFRLPLSDPPLDSISYNVESKRNAFPLNIISILLSYMKWVEYIGVYHVGLSLWVPVMVCFFYLLKITLSVRRCTRPERTFKNDPHGSSLLTRLTSNGTRVESLHKRLSLDPPIPLQRETLFLVRTNDKRHFLYLIDSGHKGYLPTS